MGASVALLAAALLAVASPRALAAQTPVVRDPRATNTVQLAQLQPTAHPAAGQTRGEWTEVTLEGWVRAAAMSPSTRDGFDLIVNVSAGEDLRDAPNGAPVARLRYGVLVKRLAAREGWVQVRRAGWVQRAALAAAPAPAQKPGQNPPQPSAQAAPAPRAPVPATAPAPQAASATPAAATDRVELARAAPIYSVPEGGQLGTLQPGTSARTVGQVGEWVKVQVEGWVREGDLKASTSGALVGVTAAELRADPAKFVGQTVEWRVQLIALQVADELRPELPQGQPYLLARGPLPEPGFLYVTIKREQAAQFRAMQPLQELVLRGVVRAAQTRYLPTPVLELVSARTAEAAADR